MHAILEKSLNHEDAIKAGLKNKIILITGATGMLGSAFHEHLSHLPCKPILLSRENLDVSDLSQVLSCSSLNPDIIIHCAAKVNADLCESNPQLANKTIIEGTNNIVKLAKKSKAKLLFPQSFLIFDDNPEIDELTKPNPLSQYGKCKQIAESIILSELESALSVRMGGFFGGYEKDKNFVGKFAMHLANLSRTGIHRIEVGNRVWQPTYTSDLAANSLLLIALGKSGIYNMAALNEASFYDISHKMIKLLEISGRFDIIKVEAEKMSKRESAIRPYRAKILNKRLDQEGLNLQREWQHSIKEYLGHPFFKGLFA